MSKDTRGIDLKSIGTSVIAFGSRNTDLAVRVAIFTAIAHCCLGLLFVAGFQVYMIFETFVRPLIWALLTGTFLFPFKSFLADMVKSWLNGLRTTSTPILVGVALTPLKLVDKGLDCVGAEIVEFFRKHGWKILYVGAAVVSYFVVYFYIAPYLGVFGTMIGYVLKATTALSTHVVSSARLEEFQHYIYTGSMLRGCEISLQFVFSSAQFILLGVADTAIYDWWSESDAPIKLCRFRQSWPAFDFSRHR